MKTLIPILSIALTTFVHAQTNYPGYFRVDPSVVYLSPSVSADFGTLLSPYDCSTPAKMWSSWVKAAYGPTMSDLTHKTIVFLPGDYMVTNELCPPFEAKHITLLGYGARLHYVDPDMTGQATVLRTAWSGNDDVTIEGFTIDCGSRVKSTKSSKVCGVFSYGRNNVVRNVRVLNLFSANPPGTPSLEESFGIILNSENGLCSGNTVSGTTGTGGQIVTGIVIMGTGSSGTGNAVDLEDSSGTNALTTFAYSLYGNRLLLQGNTCRRVDTGVSMDGASSTGLAVAWRDNLITGNQFSCVDLCVRIDSNSQSYLDWTWSDNVFHTEGPKWIAMWSSNPKWVGVSRISGHKFLNCRFTGAPNKVGNLILQNFGTPHSFVHTSFAQQPSIDFGASKSKVVYGLHNTVAGQVSNKGFRTLR